MAIVWLTINDDMLDNIVAILIRQKLRGASVDVHHQPLLLITCAMLQYALDDTTSIVVRGQLRNLTLECLHDERNALLWELFNDFLDHVVPVLILCDTYYIGSELIDNGSLLIVQDMLESLPNSQSSLVIWDIRA